MTAKSKNILWTLGLLSLMTPVVQNLGPAIDWRHPPGAVNVDGIHLKMTREQVVRKLGLPDQEQLNSEWESFNGHSTDITFERGRVRWVAGSCLFQGERLLLRLENPEGGVESRLGKADERDIGEFEYFGTRCFHGELIYHLSAEKSLTITTGDGCPAAETRSPRRIVDRILLGPTHHTSETCWGPV